MSFGSRLKALMKDRKVYAKDIAEYVGVSRGLVTHWTNDKRNPNPAQVERILSFLKVDADSLFDKNNTITTKLIPLIGKSSCGTPQDYNLENYDAVPISPDIYNEGMYAVEAEGKSMSPKINDGNIVYCDPSQEVNNGNIVHYMVKGESGIKKYKINEPQTIVSLVPLNSDYDIVTVDQYENVDLRMVKVVGVVDTDF